jgi:phenylalanyl-tRNA synthetase beta chain
MGRVFGRDARDEPVEEERVALALSGPAGRDRLDRRRAVSNEEAALWLKGAVDRLAAALHAGAIELRPAGHPAMTPGWASEILLGGEPVGLLGLLSAALRHPWRLNGPLAVAELRLPPLLAGHGRLAPLREVPAFPSVRRDLALVAPPGVRHADLVAAIRAAGGADLTGVELFDIFKAKEPGRAQRSMAYALEFRSSSRTLTDDEVNAALQAVIRALREQLRVEIREG